MGLKSLETSHTLFLFRDLECVLAFKDLRSLEDSSLAQHSPSLPHPLSPLFNQTFINIP